MDLACKTPDLVLKIGNIGRRQSWWDEKKCHVVQCDVDNDDDVQRVMGQRIIHALIHAVAYSPAFPKRVVDTTREDFMKTMETSTYSLLALTKFANFEEKGASVTALTFDASQRVVPGYFPMAPAKAALETTARYLAWELGSKGVRVNCVSPGPIATPAARAIPDFKALTQEAMDRSFLKRNATAEDVAEVVAFLASDQAAAITGEVIKVDCGTSRRR